MVPLKGLMWSNRVDSWLYGQFPLNPKTRQGVRCLAFGGCPYIGAAHISRSSQVRILSITNTEVVQN